MIERSSSEPPNSPSSGENRFSISKSTLFGPKNRVLAPTPDLKGGFDPLQSSFRSLEGLLLEAKGSLLLLVELLLEDGDYP